MIRQGLKYFFFLLPYHTGWVSCPSRKKDLHQSFKNVATTYRGYCVGQGCGTSVNYCQAWNADTVYSRKTCHAHYIVSSRYSLRSVVTYLDELSTHIKLKARWFRRAIHSDMYIRHWLKNIIYTIEIPSIHIYAVILQFQITVSFIKYIWTPHMSEMVAWVSSKNCEAQDHNYMNMTVGFSLMHRQLP